MSARPLAKLRKCDLIRFIRSNSENKDQRMLRREGLKPLEISQCNAYRFTNQQLLDKAYRLNGNGKSQTRTVKRKKDKKLWQMRFSEYFKTRSYYPAYEKASRSQGTGQKGAVSMQKRARDSHSNIVKKAIIRGEDVPQAVIDDHYYLKRDLEKLRPEAQPERITHTKEYRKKVFDKAFRELQRKEREIKKIGQSADFWRTSSYESDKELTQAGKTFKKAEDAIAESYVKWGDYILASGRKAEEQQKKAQESMREMLTAVRELREIKDAVREFREIRVK